jgi:PUA domain protein
LKIKNRHFLKSKDIKKFQRDIQQIHPNADALFQKNSKLEKATLEDGTNLYFLEGELTFFEREDKIIPFLRILLKNLIQLPKITIDTGAIPYIIKGATVMIPGIVFADEKIKKGDYVVIVDENHDKPLAIGIALMDANEISKEKKGKAIKTIHFIGDKLWDFVKKLEGK